MLASLVPSHRLTFHLMKLYPFDFLRALYLSTSVFVFSETLTCTISKITFFSVILQGFSLPTFSEFLE